MDTVERLGRPENTLFIFTSEQATVFSLGQVDLLRYGLRRRLSAGPVRSSLLPHLSDDSVCGCCTYADRAAGGKVSGVDPPSDAKGNSGFDGRSF